MIISMTGYGQASLVKENFIIGAEVRSVNSRYLNIKQRLPDALASLEIPLQQLIRSEVPRGMVTLTVKVEAAPGAAASLVNRELLKAYLREIQEANRELDASDDVSINALLSLPGVIKDVAEASVNADAVRSEVLQVVRQALAQMNEMRQAEGHSTEEELRQLCKTIADRVPAIAARAPLVVQEYQQRLRERAQTLLAKAGVELTGEELLKEIAFFAERADIAEELARLQSHLEQFTELMDSDEPVGRRLEFVTQEMHREANTIGAKAADAEIARLVLEIKSAIDRLREQVENVQ